MNNFVRKLSSRKFWLAVAAFVAGLIVAFGGDQAMADSVSGCIMSGAAVVAYIIGEGLADSSAALAPTREEEINGDNI